jgi:hypothetical protein
MIAGAGTKETNGVKKGGFVSISRFLPVSNFTEKTAFRFVLVSSLVSSRFLVAPIRAEFGKRTSEAESVRFTNPAPPRSSRSLTCAACQWKEFPLRRMLSIA